MKSGQIFTRACTCCDCRPRVKWFQSVLSRRRRCSHNHGRVVALETLAPDWASNATLDGGFDFFVANRGNNTIVRMTLGESSFLGVAGKLLSVGGLPLLAVLASQFPAFAEFISGWIKPISDALH